MPKQIEMYKLGVVLNVAGAKGLSTLKQADKELKSVDADARKAEASVGRFGGALNKLSSGVKSLFGGSGGGFLPGVSHISNIIQGLPQIGQLAGSLVSPLTDAAQAGIKFNAFLETTEIGLKTTLFGGSRDRARQFIREMRDFAQASPFRTEPLIKTAQYMGAVGFKAQEIKPVLRDIGDAIAATGEISEEAVQSVARAFGKIRSEGRVTAESMEMLTDANIPAWEMLAHAIGKSVADTRKLSEQGKLNGPAAVEAIRAEMRARYGGMMDELQASLTGRLSALEDTVQAAQGKATEKLTQDISESVAAGLNRAGLIDNLAGTINTAIAPVSGLIRAAAVGALGGGLTGGLAEGITAGKGLVTKTVTDLALDSVISPFKSLLGINSPSLVYNEFGQNVAQGFEDGLVDRTSRGFDRWATALERAGGDAFIKGIEQIAKRLGIDPAHLMNVMAFESGFNPRARNPKSSARGLIQFMDSTAQGLGLRDSDAFLKMSAMEQVKWVERYFQPYAGRMHNQGDVYAAVAGPKALFNGGTLYRRGSREYRDNRVWDANKDGVITSREIGGLAASTGQFKSGGFTVNNSPVSDTNPVPVYGVAGAKGGLGIGGSAVAGARGGFTSDTFDPAAAPAVLARAQADLSGKLRVTAPVVGEVNDQMSGLVTTTGNVVGVEGLFIYQTQQLTQATAKQTLAAGHAAASVIGLAKSVESTGEKLFNMIGGLAGIVPQQQVGRKRGFFSKLLGFAAPFLSFIPGVGPILSAAAGIGSSALAGDWAGAITGAVSGFRPGGVFRGSGSGGGGSLPTGSFQPGELTSIALNSLTPRAGGGPVTRGRAYLVGERRAEMFVPGADGWIHPDAGAFARRAEQAQGTGGHGLVGGVLARLVAQLERMESRPAGEWLHMASRENPGAITDGFMRHGSRDPRVVEWMNRRVSNQ